MHGNYRSQDINDERPTGYDTPDDDESTDSSLDNDTEKYDAQLRTSKVLHMALYFYLFVKVRTILL